MDLNGPVEVDLVRESVESIQLEYDIHRLTFDFSQGEPRYFYRKELEEYQFKLVDCSAEENPELASTAMDEGTGEYRLPIIRKISV